MKQGMKNNRSRRQTKAECHGGKREETVIFSYTRTLSVKLTFFIIPSRNSIKSPLCELNSDKQGEQYKVQKRGMGGVLMQVCKHKAEMH